MSKQLPESTRAKALRMYHQRTPLQEIARETQVSPNTLRAWFYRRKTGNLPSAKLARDMEDRNELLKVFEADKGTLSEIYSLSLAQIHSSLKNMRECGTILEVEQIVKLSQMMEKIHRIEKGSREPEATQPSESTVEVGTITLSQALAQSPILTQLFEANGETDPV